MKFAAASAVAVLSAAFVSAADITVVVGADETGAAGLVRPYRDGPSHRLLFGSPMLTSFHLPPTEIHPQPNHCCRW